MGKVTELYTPKSIEKLEKKKKILTVLSSFIGGAALLTCILLCVFTNTKNAEFMEKTAIIVFIVSGWIDLYLIMDGVLALKREITHAEMLNRDERQAYTGTVRIDKDRMRIRGSIAFYPVNIELLYPDDTSLPEALREKEKKVRIIDTRIKQFRPLENKNLKVYVANGYIAAWEEIR